VKDLIEVLLAIPQTDQGNQIKAAGLHISPNQLRYRLKKIEGIPVTHQDK
jgi:sugar diacid utilization regulator